MLSIIWSEGGRDVLTALAISWRKDWAQTSYRRFAVFDPFYLLVAHSVAYASRQSVFFLIHFLPLCFPRWIHTYR